ncbi:hypothetical protein BVY02_00260 [bacterium J17]|nr:hypothetical protein BVY02_00260 [bacterium J17]
MKIVIIGNGITGISFALKLRELQPDWTITVISGEHPNHYSRPALMYIYMGHMKVHHTEPFPKSHFTKNKIDLIHDWVISIDCETSNIKLKSGETVSYDQLLIATGSRPNKFGWPGQDLDGVQGFYDLMDLELLEKNTPGTTSSVIVGGGLIGIELAEMLHSRGIDVTFLVRESSYWNRILPAEESEMVNHAIVESGIRLILSTNLREILSDDSGRARAVVTEFDEEIPCQLVGLTAGVSPNIELAKSAGIECERGILVDEDFRSNIANVYSAGDCAQLVATDGSKKLEQLWYTGKEQAEVLARKLAGEEVNYTRGVFYNSAKFLDIEYQIYGEVPSDTSETDHFFWMSNDKRKSIRFVCPKSKEHVIGFNAMGIRLRHRLCEQWIEEKRSLNYVIENLSAAEFDPEFTANHHSQIIEACKEPVR